MEGLDRYLRRTNARCLRALIPIALIALTALRLSMVTMKAAGDGDVDGTGCDPARMTLRFRLVNEAGAHPASLERAMLEAQTIWATAGVHLVWTTAALASESLAPARIEQGTLAADCPADRTIARGASGNDMWATAWAAAMLTSSCAAIWCGCITMPPNSAGAIVP